MSAVCRTMLKVMALTGPFAQRKPARPHANPRLARRSTVYG
jgi:hypothetical protein